MTHTTFRGNGHLTQLTNEWTERYYSRMHDFGDLGYVHVGQLEEHIHSASRDEANRILRTLIELGHAGDKLAERLVLQVMLPKASALAKTCTGLRALTHVEAQWSAVGAMWEAVRTYPLHRTSSVVGNLALNALEIIRRDYRAPAPKGFEELTVTDEDLESLLNDGAPEADEPTWGDTAFHNLVKVLTWAVETGTLTRDEVAILGRIELGEAHERDSLADELELTRAALDKRVWRTRVKLMDAVRDHIRTHGRW